MLDLGSLIYDLEMLPAKKDQGISQWQKSDFSQKL